MAVIEEIDSNTNLSKEELAKLFEDEQNILNAQSAKDIDAVNKFFGDDDEDEDEDEDENVEEVKSDEVLFREGVNQVRDQYQPTTMEKIFAMVKSLILRALVFYVIMWFMKRNNVNPTSKLESNAPSLDEAVDDFEEMTPFGSREDL